ncbi:DNA primase, partial [Micromonospora sp. M51]|nr:DNA primase [Micromonospora sp. M51]
MWGNVGPRVAELSPLERVRLRRVAIRYAAHGWQVTPGACLARSRFVCGRAGCPTVGCHPALENWE